MKYFLIAGALAGALLMQSCSTQSTGVLRPEQSGGWLLGPAGGVNIVNYKTDAFAVLGTEPQCFQAQNGSDVAFHVGLTGEIPLGDGMQNFIIAEVLYDSKSSKFTTNSLARTDIPTKLNGVVEPGNVVTSETATLNYLLANAGYKYNFTTGPSPVGPAVQLCLSVGVPMTVTLNKNVTVSASNGNPNAPGISQKANALSVANNLTPGVSNSLRIGLRGQFDYDIPLSGDGSWTATPAVGYDFPFTKVDNSAKNWSASAAYGQIAVRYMIR